MDLLALRIDLMDNGRASAGAVHLRAIDSAGRRELLLQDEAAARVIHDAEPLLVRLSQEGGGPLQVLVVDFVGETLRAVCLREGAAAGGAAADDYVRALWQERGGVNMGEVGEVPPHLLALVSSGVEYRQMGSLLRELARSALRQASQRGPEAEPDPSDPARWEQRYRSGVDGWELGRAAPPLVRYLAEHPPDRAPIFDDEERRPRALVVGAGRGHEARLLARLGVDVTAVDFAPSAVAACRALADAEGLTMTVLEADVFDLPRTYARAFDLLLEHTCYCAIDPARRGEYADAAAALLRPGGRLLGLFWCHQDPGGPPFGATEEELLARFAGRFTVLHREIPPDSVARRHGQERLLLLRREAAVAD